jgi:hypothetical protein
MRYVGGQYAACICVAFPFHVLDLYCLVPGYGFVNAESFEGVVYVELFYLL